MRIGPAVRRLFGRYEHRIAAFYRALFFDIDDYKRQLQAWAPGPKRILEVGCGEGAVTEVLVELYPSARITAIDIMPAVGRLYRGPSETVQFRQVLLSSASFRSLSDDVRLRPWANNFALLAHA